MGYYKYLLNVCVLSIFKGTSRNKPGGFILKVYLKLARPIFFFVVTYKQAFMVAPKV